MLQYLAWEYILKQRHPERFAYYRLKRLNKILYAVIFGDFAKLSDVKKAALQSGFNKPLIRKFGTLRKIIKKQ